MFFRNTISFWTTCSNSTVSKRKSTSREKSRAIIWSLKNFLSSVIRQKLCLYWCQRMIWSLYSELSKNIKNNPRLKPTTTSVTGKNRSLRWLIMILSSMPWFASASLRVTRWKTTSPKRIQRSNRESKKLSIREIKTAKPWKNKCWLRWGKSLTRRWSGKAKLWVDHPPKPNPKPN